MRYGNYGDLYPAGSDRDLFHWPICLPGNIRLCRHSCGCCYCLFNRKPKYYGEKDWERVPTPSNRKNISLGTTEKQILELLRIGHIYMADITDSLGVDSNTSGKAIENLDQGGCLMRAGMIGTKFYTFSITQKGLDALKPLSDKEAKMAREGLTPSYVELLRILKDSPEKQADFTAKYNIKSMRMSAISSHLTRQGYIKEKGLFKRKLEITAKGAAAVQKYM